MAVEGFPVNRVGLVPNVDVAVSTILCLLVCHICRSHPMSPVPFFTSVFEYGDTHRHLPRALVPELNAEQPQSFWFPATGDKNHPGGVSREVAHEP